MAWKGLEEWWTNGRINIMEIRVWLGLRSVYAVINCDKAWVMVVPYCKMVSTLQFKYLKVQKLFVDDCVASASDVEHEHRSSREWTGDSSRSGQEH